MTTTRVLLVRMSIAEWILPRKRTPGRRIVARVGHVEIERMFSGVGSVSRIRTGAWYRRRGWGGDMDRINRLRLTVPWIDGSLWFMAARDDCAHA